MAPTNLVLFTYQHNDVAFDPAAKMWSLTAMHQAAGGEPHKAPAQWLRNQQTQALIAALAADVNYANLHNSVEIRRGATGGTWAHWQIAAAYAHYLRADFYLQWNRWAMERVTGLTIGAPATVEARLTAVEARLTALETPPAPPVPLTLAAPPEAEADVAVPDAPAVGTEIDRLAQEAEALALARAAVRWQQHGHSISRSLARPESQVIIACFRCAEGGTRTAADVAEAMEQVLGRPPRVRSVHVRLRRLEGAGVLARLRHGVYAYNTAALDAPALSAAPDEALAARAADLAEAQATARLRQERHDIPRMLRNRQTQAIIALLRAASGPLTVAAITPVVEQATGIPATRYPLRLLLRRLAAAGLLVRPITGHYALNATAFCDQK